MDKKNLGKTLKIVALEQLGKLRDCEVHCSVLLSSVDENTLKKLGVHLTCTAKSDKKLIY